MRAYTGVTVVFIVLFAAVSVECASHKHHKGKHAKHEETDVESPDDPQWPQPIEIKNFDVPPGVTEGLPDVDGVSTVPPSGNRRGRKH